mgnify:CR=1 FL=1
MMAELMTAARRGRCGMPDDFVAEENSLDDRHGLKKCDKQGCDRRVRVGIYYCCHGCHTAYGFIAEPLSGTGHTEACDERHHRRQARKLGTQQQAPTGAEGEEAGG